MRRAREKNGERLIHGIKSQVNRSTCWHVCVTVNNSFQKAIRMDFNSFYYIEMINARVNTCS